MSKTVVHLKHDGWSIEVPERFVYSDDESKNGESKVNPNGRYELIILQPKPGFDPNFEEHHHNRISFVTLDRVDALKANGYYSMLKDAWITVKEDPGLSVKFAFFSYMVPTTTYQIMIATEKSYRRCFMMFNTRLKRTEMTNFVHQLLSTVKLTKDISVDEDAFCAFNDDTMIHTPQWSSAEDYAKEHDMSVDHRQAPVKAVPKAKKTTSKVAKADAKPIVETTPAEPVAPFSLSASGKTLNKYEGKETVVVVPDGVTEISSFAFSDTKVTSVTLPDSVKKIGQYAFNGCTKLEQIRMPESVTSVGGYAFAKCSALKEITWPGSIKKLPNSACNNCSALETVVIEEGVTEIDQSAFSFCGKLKDIFLPVSVEKIGDFMILMSGNPTFHAYLDSYGEKYAKENNLPTQILLTPEQEAEKKRQEEARRIAEEKYAAELKAWEQACGEIRTLREQRVSELLEEKRTALQNEAQSKYNTAVAAANKRKEAAQQKKSDAEMRLSALGIFKFAEKKAAKTAIEEATGEIQAAETALVTAKQTFDKDLASIPATINSRRYMVAREVEHEYPLPAKPEKPTA